MHVKASPKLSKKGNSYVSIVRWDWELVFYIFAGFFFEVELVFSAIHSDWLNLPQFFLGKAGTILVLLKTLLKLAISLHIYLWQYTSFILLDLFLTSDESISSEDLYPPLGRSDHEVVSVSINFATSSKKGSTFHLLFKAFDYSRAGWVGFLDLLRDITSKENFFWNLPNSATVRK